MYSSIKIICAIEFFTGSRPISRKIGPPSGASTWRQPCRGVATPCQALIGRRVAASKSWILDCLP